MRYALVKDGVTIQIVECTPERMALIDPAWRAQWDDIVMHDKRPDARHPTMVVTRDAEPGASYDRNARTFSRGSR